MRTQTLLALGALAASAATPVAAQTAPSVPAETLLSLTATGESTRVPDIAVISAGVVTQAAEARAALTANNSQMTRVVAALKKAGIAERDIQTSNINLNPQYSYEERKAPQLIGYQANNTVTVKLRKLAGAGDVIDALVSEGANQVNGPSIRLGQGRFGCQSRPSRNNVFARTMMRRMMAVIATFFAFPAVTSC